ncbi:MAG: DUF3577 domain-containing protein [Methylophilaceae bacterium]|nr:DUF3577 domain-containing protein [Methylophilaceae bacterium]
MSDSKFFDLHVTGLGYLNRVRMVNPKKGDSFVACSIAALRGEWNKEGSIKPESTKFDVRVSGSDAKLIIDLLGPFNDKNRKVMIQFKLGDIYGETYVYEKNTEYAKKGDVGMMIKGRLLKIYRAWINGEQVDLSAVYPEEANTDQSAASEEYASAKG